MAYRKVYRKRRVFRKKRPFNMMRRRVYRKPATTYIKRTVVLSTLAGSDATPSFGQGLTFKLTDLPSYTEMTNLFDRFTIKKVEYRWYIEQDPNLQTTKKFPQISWVHQFTTAGSPSTLSEIQQFSKYRHIELNDNKPMTRKYTIRPACLGVAYVSGVSSSYKAMWGQFLDCADSGAPFYGVRAYIQNLQAGVTLNCECTYHIQLRGIK